MTKGFNEKINKLNDEFARDYERPDPEDNEPRYLDRQADYREAENAKNERLLPIANCAERAKEIQEKLG